jgi:hypothetical protein
VYNNTSTTQTVCTNTSIGHGHLAGLDVLELEILVRELLAIDGLAASAVTFGKVSSLCVCMIVVYIYARIHACAYVNNLS